MAFTLYAPFRSFFLFCDKDPTDRLAPDMAVEQSFPLGFSPENIVHQPHLRLLASYKHASFIHPDQLQIFVISLSYTSAALALA